MQIGLMSVRAAQGPGLWELIPSLLGRNRPPSFPAPLPAPPPGTASSAGSYRPVGGRRIRPQGGQWGQEGRASSQHRHRLPLPLCLSNLGFTRLRPGLQAAPCPALEGFSASHPRICVTQVLTNTNGSITPARAMRSAARLQNGPRTDYPAQGHS